MRELAARLIGIPGVVAVTLGGSLAGGLGRPDGDRGFWLYYRGDLRADEVRALGLEARSSSRGSGGGWRTAARG